MLSPVMGEPPLSAGAVQLRPICEEEAAVAVSPVGGDGATARVVAEAVAEGEPVPAELMAETRSEEGGVGEERRSGWAPADEKKKDTIVLQVVPTSADLSI